MAAKLPKQIEKMGKNMPKMQGKGTVRAAKKMMKG
jgi:hypothetical protein